MGSFWTKNKPTVLTAVLALLAVGVVSFDKFTQSPSSGENYLGQNELFDSEKLQNLDLITISRGEGTTTLEKREGGVWYVVDSQSVAYPADASKVLGFIDTLLGIKVERLVSSKSEENLSVYGLDIPTKIKLSAGGSNLIDLDTGSQRDGGGQFILAGENILLISKQISADSNSDSWEAKTLVSIPPKDVKSVQFSLGSKKSEFILQREKAEDSLAFKDAPAEQKYNNSEIKSPTQLLEKLSFEKRVPASNEEAKAALKDGTSTLVELFDGRQFVVKIGKIGKKDEEKYFLEMTPPSGSTKVEDQVTKEMSSNFAFEISSYNAKKFSKEKSDFEEK